MAYSATLQGARELTRAFDQSPKNLQKVIKTAMRAGASATSRQVKNGVPSRWSDLTKSKVKTDFRGNTFARVGLRSKSRRQGPQDEVSDWFKAYWANYGTLENRDPSHKFANPVRHRTTTAARRRKNKGGQKPQRFFEGAIVGWEDTFLKAFEKSIEKQKNKILK